ncbi:tetratricopeptide repeat protein [Ramlibacter sp.]|uniref:class I SAM-dependent DNA methyltransferase n=1 Tax=Ramlibacter sp. TaxID=1917967 RepID=UPI003D10F54D
MSDANFRQAREFFLSGLAHYQAGRFVEAERDFAASLSLVPGRPSTLTNLGATRLKLGRFEEAVAMLDQAIAAEPDNVEALGHRATGLAEMGLLREALADFDRVVAITPDAAAAWTLRGSVLNDLGRQAEAADSYRESLRLGGDAELNRYYLAAAARGEAPRTAPRFYVESLFDNYALGFDEQLVASLRYRAPQILVAGLQREKRIFASAIDLGCGTGLCGPLLKPLCARLEGVDLSRGMLAKAEALGVYDALAHADLLDALRASAQPCDLAVAADVFIYVGALDAVFEALARRMPAGGMFCFSLEESEGGEALQLRQSRRYAHSENYVRELAARTGFEVRALERAPVREEQRVPIPGLYFWLARKD